MYRTDDYRSDLREDGGGLVIDSHTYTKSLYCWPSTLNVVMLDAGTLGSLPQCHGQKRNSFLTVLTTPVGILKKQWVGPSEVVTAMVIWDLPEAIKCVKLNYPGLSQGI